MWDNYQAKFPIINILNFWSFFESLNFMNVSNPQNLLNLSTLKNQVYNIHSLLIMSLIAHEFPVMYKAGTLCIWMYGYPSCLLLHINTLYGMLMLWLNVNTFISSKKINWLEWMNKGQAMAQRVLWLESQRFVPITILYKILEGENFGEFGELQVICQNFLLWMIRSIHETACLDSIVEVFSFKDYS